MPDLTALDGFAALLMLAATTLLHELGAPLPLAPAAFFVGARAAAGSIDPLLAIAAIVPGMMIGNSVWFAAGRRYGVGVLKLVSRLPMSGASGLEHGAARFERWGPSSIVIGRFVPGISLIAPPLAGALGMRWGRFLLLTAAGSVLYSAVFVGAGMFLHHQSDSAFALLDRFGGYVLAAVAVAAAVYIGRGVIRRTLQRWYGMTFARHRHGDASASC